MSRITHTETRVKVDMEQHQALYDAYTKCNLLLRGEERNGFVVKTKFEIPLNIQLLSPDDRLKDAMKA